MTQLCFLPGLICDHYVWSFQLSRFRDCQLTTVIDYGAADSISAMAQKALAETQGPLALAGHSMGGRVALEMFTMEPERIERIALLDTGVHPVRLGEREKRMDLVQIGRKKGMNALVDSWLPPMVHPRRRSDDAFMAPLRDMARKAGLDRFEEQTTALLKRPDASLVLNEIRVPTLVGTGRQDEWSPPLQHAAIAQRISDAQLVIFEDTGHMSPLEAPDQVNEAIARWLER